MTRLIVCTVCLASAAAAAQERPGPHRLSDDRFDAVLGGRPYAYVDQGEDNNNRAELVAVINAAPDEVWRVIMDYERYETWFPDQEEASIVSQSGTSRVLSGTTAVPILRDRTYRLEERSNTTTTAEGHTAYVDTWEYIPESGNLESTTGFWFVEPLDAAGDQTIIRMVVHANLGIWLPDAILNWGTRRMMPGIAQAIQARCDAQ